MWSVVWGLNEVVRILLTECYEVLRVGELLEKFLNVHSCCSCFFAQFCVSGMARFTFTSQTCT